MAKRFALIGKNIQHSRSPLVYQRLLGEPVDYRFLDFESPEAIPSLADLLAEHVRISITAPYKKFVFENVDLVEAHAREFEAVNAIKLDGGRVIGTNTDALALREIFLQRFLKPDLNVLILGDGAMARMAKSVMESENVAYKILSRRAGTLEKLSEKVAAVEGDILVINSCSREYEIQFESSKSLKIWDLNYGLPRHSTFADKNGFKYFDGEELLIRQAQYALSFWNL